MLDRGQEPGEPGNAAHSGRDVVTGLFRACSTAIHLRGCLMPSWGGFFWRFAMSHQGEPEAISRRKMLSLLGLVAATTVAVPSTILTVSEAEAQATSPVTPPPASPPGPPGPPTAPGTERRQERRASRRKRRAARRAARRKAREERAKAKL